MDDTNNILMIIFLSILHVNGHKLLIIIYHCCANFASETCAQLLNVRCLVCTFLHLCVYVAHTCSLKKSTKIPEVVSCQQKLNSHLEERKLFHCNYSNANDLKLKTDLEQCLLAFTSIDTLDEDNKFICQTCSNGKCDSCIVMCIF